MEDRRRWKRLRSELRLHVQLLDDSGTRAVSAIGSHLNPEGIFVQLADPPALGARVRVTLAAEGTDGVLTAEGTVVDRVVPDDGSARPPGIGICLTQPGPAWAKLYAFLSETSGSDD
jgi:Tfp pilus assembly protein PilZ